MDTGGRWALGVVAICLVLAVCLLMGVAGDYMFRMLRSEYFPALQGGIGLIAEVSIWLLSGFLGLLMTGRTNLELLNDGLRSDNDRQAFNSMFNFD